VVLETDGGFNVIGRGERGGQDTLEDLRRRAA
jgi:hypothetical protein